jgi:hypothetical protein
MQDFLKKQCKKCLKVCHYAEMLLLYTESEGFYLIFCLSKTKFYLTVNSAVIASSAELLPTKIV